MRRADPNPAHQALNVDLRAMMERYASMPVIERLAVLAQFMGAEIASVPRDYSSAEVLQAISFNLAAGNQGAGADMVVVGDA